MNMGEIKKFMNLLKEWGFTGYRLTGPVENPIITTWGRATVTVQSSEQTPKGTMA